MYTRSLSNIWYSLAIYNSKDYKKVLRATTAAQKASEEDPNVGFFVNSSPSGFFAGLLYAEPTDWPDAFAGFRDLQVVTTLANATNGTLFDLSAAVTSPIPPAL